MISDKRSVLGTPEYEESAKVGGLTKAIILARKEGTHVLVMSKESLYAPIVVSPDWQGAAEDMASSAEGDLTAFYVANPAGRPYARLSPINSGIVRMLYDGRVGGPGGLLFDLETQHPTFYGFYEENRRHTCSSVCGLLRRFAKRGFIEKDPVTDRSPVRYYMTPEQKAMVLY